MTTYTKARTKTHEQVHERTESCESARSHNNLTALKTNKETYKNKILLKLYTPSY